MPDSVSGVRDDAGPSIENRVYSLVVVIDAAFTAWVFSAPGANVIADGFRLGFEGNLGLRNLETRCLCEFAFGG